MAQVDTQSVYSFLDDWFGEYFCEKTLERGDGSFPPEQSDALLRAYLAEPRADPPKVSAGELRPFVGDPSRMLPFYTSLNNLREFEQADPLNLLLYAHAVSLPNPLTQNPRFPWGIGAELRKLAELRPLSELGALYWVDIRTPYDPKPAYVRKGREYYRWDSRVGEILGWAEREYFMADPGDGFDQQLEGDLTIDFAIATQRSLLAALECDERGLGQLYSLNPVERMLLKGHIAAPDTHSHWPRGMDLLSLLIKLRSPLLDVPTVGDLVGLRENSDQFAEWRNDLQEALLTVESLVPTEEGWLEIGQRVMADKLGPRARRIEKELRNSPAEAGGLAAGSFALSGIAVGVAGFLGAADIPQVLAGGAASAVAAGVASYFQALRRRRGSRALLASHSSLMRFSR